MKSLSDKEKVSQFYQEYTKHIHRQMQVMTRESSIQLVFQICLTIHQFLNFPAIELIYDNTIRDLATAQCRVVNIRLDKLGRAGPARILKWTVPDPKIHNPGSVDPWTYIANFFDVFIGIQDTFTTSQG